MSLFKATWFIKVYDFFVLLENWKLRNLAVVSSLFKVTTLRMCDGYCIRLSKQDQHTIYRVCARYLCSTSKFRSIFCARFISQRIQNKDVLPAGYFLLNWYVVFSELVYQIERIVAPVST